MDNSYAYINNGNITEYNVAFYEAHGYLIAPGLVSIEEIAALKKETAAIFRGKCGYVEGMLSIGADEPDSEVLKKYVAIHFPHKISKVIYDFLIHKKIVDVLTKI